MGPMDKKDRAKLPSGSSWDSCFMADLGAWSCLHDLTQVRALSRYDDSGPDGEPGDTWVVSLVRDYTVKGARRLARVDDKTARWALKSFGLRLNQVEEMPSKLGTPTRVFLRFVPSKSRPDEKKVTP